MTERFTNTKKKENKQIIKKNANNIVWVEYWLDKFDPKEDCHSLFAEEIREGVWECNIEYPGLFGDITARASSEIDAIVNAAESAAKLIKQFIEKCPETKIMNPYEKYNYEIFKNERGGVEISLSKEDRRRESEQMMNKQVKVMEQINKTIDMITSEYGMTDQLFLKIIDKKVFPDMDIRQIKEFCEVDISNNTDRELHPFLTYEKGDYVVILGHLGWKA